MTLLKKILFIAALVLIILFCLLYVFAVFKGKEIIVSKLSQATGRKVTIGYFDVRPPLTIQINNLNIEGLAKVGSVSVSPSIIGFLSGNTVLNSVKLVNPQITYEKNSAQQQSSSVGISTAKSQAKRMLRFALKNFVVKGGSIDFIDRAATSQGLLIRFRDTDLSLTNLYLMPHSMVTSFQLSGRMPWSQGQEEGKIEAEGWVNLFKKDAQAVLKITDIDGVYLYPYYSGWIDLEKARIEKARLNFSSNIQALNNKVTADCHLELTDIIRKPLPPEEEEARISKITNAVLDIFKVLNQGNIMLDFTVHTKMDSPEFGFSNIRMALEAKIAKVRGEQGIGKYQALGVPFKLLEGFVKGATDLSKAAVDGTFAVGNELKKAVNESFKKDKQK
jgi:uncharacterized protein involved in outer membrane biogenesis